MKKKLKQQEQNRSRDIKRYEAKMHETLRKVFTPGQIRMLLKPNVTRITWSSEDIASAISLRCISPKAYRYMRNVVKMPLPGLSTLRRWACNINVDPGILDAILDCMKYKGKTLQMHEKLVILTFDEIHLCNKIAIDRKLQQVVGSHKSCQRVMVRSLFSKWKQPIYYDYDKAMTKDTLLCIISRLYDIGYTVIGMTWAQQTWRCGLN